VRAFDQTACRGCGESALRLALDLGSQPLAGGFLAGPRRSRESSSSRCAHSCVTGALSSRSSTSSIPTSSSRTTRSQSSTIPPLVAHFREYATWLHDRYGPARVVEFGCNDGVLLEPLQELGVDAWGVDISENITDSPGRKACRW